MIYETYTVTIPGAIDLPGAQVYRFTSKQTSVVISGETYQPAVLRRSPVTAASTGKVASQKIELRVPVESELAEHWYAYPPDVEVAVEVQRVTLGDEANAETVFIGTVGGDYQQGPWHVLEVLPRGADLGRLVPVGEYSSLCRWALYSPQCGVNPATRRRAGNVQDESQGERLITVRLTVAGSGSNINLLQPERWVGGFAVPWTGTQEQGERRLIYAVTDSTPLGSDVWDVTFLLHYWFTRGPSSLGQVAVFEGCQKTIQVCHAQHANALNFGGFPKLPAIDRVPFGFGYREGGQ